MRTDRGWRRFYATGWLVSAAATAVALRLWQARVREIEARAEEAVRSREEAARRRAVEERLRIARELHDSLTHSISVIKVQAGVAAHLAEKRGEEVPASLRAIVEASADATRELRSTLSALREQADTGSGLAQLPLLLERARAGGRRGDVEPANGTPGTSRERRPRGIPHRPGGPDQRQAARGLGPHDGLHLSYRPRSLTVQVDNDGPRPEGPPVPGLGSHRHARAGHRPRATSAQTPREGGFFVAAELPLDAVS